MGTRDKVLCPVCGVNKKQRDSQRCAPCAYRAKSIASRVKKKRLIKRMLVDRTLVVVMEEWQAKAFVDIVLGARMAAELG